MRGIRTFECGTSTRAGLQAGRRAERGRQCGAACTTIRVSGGPDQSDDAGHPSIFRRRPRLHTIRIRCSASGHVNIAVSLRTVFTRRTCGEPTSFTTAMRIDDRHETRTTFGKASIIHRHRSIPLHRVYRTSTGPRDRQIVFVHHTIIRPARLHVRSGLLTVPMRPYTLSSTTIVRGS